MNLIQRLNVEPTNWARIRSGTRTVAEGTGIAKSVLPWWHTVEIVPSAIQSTGFQARELSQDNQQVASSGMIVYTAQDPERIANAFDFTWNVVEGEYSGEGRNLLSNFLQQTLTQPTREFISSRPLDDLLGNKSALAAKLTEIATNTLSETYGIRVDAVYVDDLAPTNRDVMEALGATTREKILTTQAEAQYGRRMRTIELDYDADAQTIQNDVKLEDQRAQLLAKRHTNRIAEANTDLEARNLALQAYEGANNERLLGIALLDMAQRGVDHLVIGPELYGALAGNKNGK